MTAPHDGKYCAETVQYAWPRGRLEEEMKVAERAPHPAAWKAMYLPLPPLHPTAK